MTIEILQTRLIKDLTISVEKGQVNKLKNLLAIPEIKKKIEENITQNYDENFLLLAIRRIQPEMMDVLLAIKGVREDKNACHWASLVAHRVRQCVPSHESNRYEAILTSIDRVLFEESLRLPSKTLLPLYEERRAAVPIEEEGPAKEVKKRRLTL